MSSDTPDGRANPELSDQRIDEAPEPIKALFREFEVMLVLEALLVVGINDHPSKFTETQIAEGAAEARKLLNAEARRRLEEMLRGA